MLLTKTTFKRTSNRIIALCRLNKNSFLLKLNSMHQNLKEKKIILPHLAAQLDQFLGWTNSCGILTGNNGSIGGLCLGPSFVHKDISITAYFRTHFVIQDAPNLF